MPSPRAASRTPWITGTTDLVISATAAIRRHAARQLGLFDDPVRALSPEELTQTVRKPERQRPGQTVDAISSAVFAELAMKRTRRASDLVTEAIRIARQRKLRAEITRTLWRASTSEVSAWPTYHYEISGNMAPQPSTVTTGTSHHTLLTAKATR